MWGEVAADIYHHGGAGISPRVFDSVSYNLVFVLEICLRCVHGYAGRKLGVIYLQRKDSLEDSTDAGVDVCSSAVRIG